VGGALIRIRSGFFEQDTQVALTKFVENSGATYGLIIANEQAYLRMDLGVRPPAKSFFSAEESLMEHNYDQEIARKGTNSTKWEFMAGEQEESRVIHTDRFFGEDRTLPMWVADMDFRCPEPVVQALAARALHGIYGYSAPTASFYDSVVNWMKRRHGWKIDPGWICVTPGVVPALNMLVRTFTTPGERVLIQPPVYHPFKKSIEMNQAEVAVNPLRYIGGRYSMDLADLEAKVKDPEVKMAILCSPHNPVGRVWTREELMAFGEICTRHDVLVVSDEIHGDLVYQGHSFTPYATVSPDFVGQSVICAAPSKTFNMAGLQTSAIIIPNDDLRSRFAETLLSNGFYGINSFGVLAFEVAYNEGEPWLEQVLAYVEANLDYLEDYIASQIPEISVVRPEGTYLVWLDCRKLGLDRKDLTHLMLEEAKVYLDDGVIFGPEGEGFQRINIACPRPLLVEALERIKAAIAKQ
jgi:cystathionine beta-lyase